MLLYLAIQGVFYMDLNEKAFNKFINLKKCNNIEFNLALKVYENGSIIEKHKFLKAMTEIIKKCILVLKENKSTDFNLVGSIYSYYGLSDSDFKVFFEKLYGIHKLNKLIYPYKKNPGSLSREQIFNLAKNLLWDNQKLLLLSIDLNISKKHLINIINNYSLNVLKLDKKMFDRYKLTYKSFYNYLNKEKYHFHTVLEYFIEFATEEEKQQFIEHINSNISFCKNLYEYAESNNWHREPITLHAKELNITYQEYLYLAKYYATNILRIRDIDEIIKCKRSNSIKNAFTLEHVLLQILNETDKTILFKLFSENNIIISTITNFCYSKSREFSNEQRKQYERNLLLKLYWYRNQRYIINKKDTPKKDTDEVNTINTIGNETYQNTVRLIISYLNNGIVINDIQKDFDLIDFFILFKDFNYYNYVYPFLTGKEKEDLNNFVKPMINDTHINRDTLINGYYEIQIDNNKRIITKEEIIYILDFMDKYNLPKSYILFNIALKRYLNDCLDIYNQEVPTIQ